MAPIASCEARYGSVVNVIDLHQFGAYTNSVQAPFTTINDYGLRRGRNCDTPVSRRDLPTGQAYVSILNFTFCV